MANRVYLKIFSKDGSTTEIGSWHIPEAPLINQKNQRDIGWHIFHALQNGAVKVETLTKLEVRNDT